MTRTAASLPVRLGLVCATAALTLATAGCGSSGGGSPSTTPSTAEPSTSSSSVAAPASSTASGTTSTTTVDAAFAARVDMQCALGNTYGRAHPFPFPKFNPVKPTVKDLPAIGAYFKASPDVAGHIIALGTPSTGQASWTQAVAALQAYRTNSTKQAAAASASDTKAFVATVKAFTPILKTLQTAAANAGLASSKACIGYFAG